MAACGQLDEVENTVDVDGISRIGRQGQKYDRAGSGTYYIVLSVTSDELVDDAPREPREMFWGTSVGPHEHAESSGGE